MLRIIDNKRIDLTDDEFLMYQNICKANSRDNFDGKDLFSDLFETDDSGIIICLKPPSKMFSLQVVLFLQNVMVHQHLRKIYSENNSTMKEMNNIIKEAKELLAELKTSRDTGK